MQVMIRHLRTAGGGTGISLAKAQVLQTQVQKEAFKLFSVLRGRDVSVTDQKSLLTTAALLDASSDGTDPFEKMLVDAFERGLGYANSPDHDGNEL